MELKIAKMKLSDNNLPPLDLTSQLVAGTVEEHIQALCYTLDMFKKDYWDKSWRYTWRGKEVIVVERLGEILKQAIGNTPLVWAGV